MDELRELGIYDSHPAIVEEKLIDLKATLEDILSDCPAGNRRNELEAKLMRVENQIKKLQGQTVASNEPTLTSSRGVLPISIEQTVDKHTGKFISSADRRSDKALLAQHEKELAQRAAELVKNEKENGPSEEDIRALLVEGTSSFDSENYTVAFKDLSCVVNHESRNLSSAEIGLAEFDLYLMYKNGYGVSPDGGRALYYLERSANHGNAKGCFLYGRYYENRLSRKNMDEREALDNALEYYKRAASAGHPHANAYYAVLCQKEKYSISKKQQSTAIKFCRELGARETDLYKRDQWKKRAADLSQARFDTIHRRCFYNFTDILAIIGAIFSIVGILLFAYDGLGEYLPIFRSAIVNRFYEIFLSGYPVPVLFGSVLAQFGDEVYVYYGAFFLFIGWLISGFSSPGLRGVISEIFCEISLIFSVIISFLTLYYLSDSTMFINFTQILSLLLLMVICFCCKLPGYFVREYLIMDEN